jgi:hypothetical protein
MQTANISAGEDGAAGAFSGGNGFAEEGKAQRTGGPTNQPTSPGSGNRFRYYNNILHTCFYLFLPRYLLFIIFRVLPFSLSFVLLPPSLGPSLPLLGPP